MLCILLYICIMNTEFLDNWQSQVKKGTLSFIVLLILDKGELYGYELIEKIKNLTAIEIAEGTLYPLMNRLKSDNLLESKWVEQETGIPRKYYLLTETGKSTLREMKCHWHNMQSTITTLMK